MFQRLAILFLTILFVGCDSSTQTEGVSGQQIPTRGRAGVVLPTQILDGTVALPAGSNLRLGELRVENSLSETAVAGNGAFSLESYQGDSQLAMVVDGQGDPVLFGWLRQGTVLDARSTAEVLLYYALGAFMAPPEVRARLVDLIADLPEVGPLILALTDALAANPKALVQGDPAINAALQVAVSAVQERVQAEEGGVNGRVLVNPTGELSGMRVNQPSGINVFSLTNMLRRPAYAFLRRISFTDQSGAVQNAELAVTEFEVPAVGGLIDLVGGLNDAGMILLGYTDQPLAYSEVTTDEVGLTPVEDAAKTSFELMVVGPGGSPGDLSLLSAAQLQKQQEVTLEFVLGELAINMALNILLPNSSLDDLLKTADGKDVIKDLVKLMLSINGQVADKALAGDVKGALEGATSIITGSDTFRNGVINLVGELVLNHRDFSAQQEFFSKFRAVLELTGAVDLALSIFDTGAIGASIAASNMADRWTFDVTESEVTIDPTESTLSRGDRVTFTARVPEADPDVPIVYRWTCEGSLGTLTDGIADHTNTFDSTSDTATYEAESSDPGTETVTVEAFLVVGSERESLGTATAVISVEESEEEPDTLFGSAYTESRFSISEGFYSVSTGAGWVIPIPQGDFTRLDVRIYNWTDGGTEPREMSFSIFPDSPGEFGPRVLENLKAEYDPIPSGATEYEDAAFNILENPGDYQNGDSVYVKGWTGSNGFGPAGPDVEPPSTTPHIERVSPSTVEVTVIR